MAAVAGFAAPSVIGSMSSPLPVSRGELWLESGTLSWLDPEAPKIFATVDSIAARLRRHAWQQKKGCLRLPNH